MFTADLPTTSIHGLQVTIGVRISTRRGFWVCLMVALLSASTSRAAEIDFEREIAPLLIKRCVECHRGAEPSGGLRLTSREGLLAGGDSGLVIDSSSYDASLLLQRVVDGEMPPEKQGRPQRLPDSEVELIRQWVLEGGVWPDGRELDFFERTNEVRAGRDWWALQPVVRPQVPKTDLHASNPIDAFVLADLAEAGISPAPRADRQTLIRRAYFDLTGMPPSESQITAFVRDEDPTAWARLVDRLLASPQYGERWARYWLDVARYADTSGYERDQEKLFAWRYRDWVTTAFNIDMTYERFVLHQLAGDEVADRNEQSVIATGFMRLGPWNDEPNDPADYRYERLEDLVHTTSSAFLALTVKCARCHSHKFDAITQEDYYRMASAFWAGPLSVDRSRDDLGGPTKDELGFDRVLGWTDVGPTPSPLHVLKNGERHQPMGEVVPASLSFIPLLEEDFASPDPGSTTTQRRLQLGRWIVDQRNPLTARVFVNRVWQHHFGKAIVRTPNNFGFLADPPTHPQLLDWLAAEFISHGGRLKPIHRLILMSQTWQQSSVHPDTSELQRRDASNRLWWRAERRRLDAETLRDSLLTASGEIDLSIGGEGFRPTINPEALAGLSRKTQAWQASPRSEQRRRSLYMYLKRGLLPPIMTSFDLCDPTQSCGKRDVTIVPTQALALLNNQFVHDRSQHLAREIAQQFSTIDEQIRQAWTQVLKRQPSLIELERARTHVSLQCSAFKSSSAETDQESQVARIRSSLVLHLRADHAVVASNSHRVSEVPDLSGQNHHAQQSDVDAQPELDRVGLGGQPTLRFGGKGQSLVLSGQVLVGPEFSIVCAVNDAQESTGHREIISNWDGAAQNSASSLFLGLTDRHTIRLTDAFADAGRVNQPTEPFLLTAVNGSEQAAVFQNGRLLKVGPRIEGRRYDTPWVIGTQGNLRGEYWHGGIAEIRVYSRQLSAVERRWVEQQMAKRYSVSIVGDDLTTTPSAEVLALASLCHVLMNSNEFLYID